MEPTELYQHARHSAAYFELPTGQALYEATGEDQERYFNGQLTNDVRQATASQGVYACICSVKGMLEGDCYIFRAPESAGGNLRISTGPELADSLLSRFDRFIIADDVLLDEFTHTWRQLHVVGPRAAESIAALSAPGGEGQWVRTDRLGLEGYDFLAPAAIYAKVREQVAAQLPELPPEVVESLRVENGRPQWGKELVRDTLPQEAGVETLAVNYHKGCYIGQEIVSRVKSAGKLRRQILGLVLEDAALPVSGADPRHLLAGTDLYASAEEGAAKVGLVTSVARSFADGGTIALASVKGGYENAGSQLWVAASGGAPAWPVRVVDLPFSGARLP